MLMSNFAPATAGAALAGTHPAGGSSSAADVGRGGAAEVRSQGA